MNVIELPLISLILGGRTGQKPPGRCKNAPNLLQTRPFVGHMDMAPTHMPTVLTTIRTVLAAMPPPAMGAGTFFHLF
ncbi:hypothetical protein LWS69_33010, partial [Bordetella hinzii]|nr:hypothetical protein [Bordetella hinzii]